MFDILFRFMCRLRKVPYDDKDVVTMLKYRTKVRMTTDFLLTLFIIIPFVFMILLLLRDKSIENMVSVFICVTAFTVFYRWFLTKFVGALRVFQILIEDTLHFKYTRKGNALSEDDFRKLAESDINLPHYLTSEKCRGDCYSTSFTLLRILKKGGIIFCAVRANTVDRTQHSELFTMHAMYVNNDWCFDTYSQLQWPLQEVLKLFEAKTYRLFTYEDLKNKSYEELRSDLRPGLSKWCEENDCWIRW